jgi:hypothetical protein
VREATRGVSASRVTLGMKAFMLGGKKAKAAQFQLALRRINHRRTAELSSASADLSGNDAVQRFPTKSHVHTVMQFMTEATQNGALGPPSSEISDDLATA